jgi:hypothetical protein
VRHAAKAFFRNTGTYVNLWQGQDIDESRLMLGNYSHKSELIRLFVFDGFVPYHEKKMVDNVSLPVGEFRRYTEKELGDMLGLPYSSWHRKVNPEIIKKAAIWHILTVREKAEYTGIRGLWIGGRLAYSFDWANIEATKKEKDVDLIGPIFLCIGEDANLAAEIRIRTNVFESSPFYQKIRNDYLPWDPDSSERPFSPYPSGTGLASPHHRTRRVWVSTSH